MELSDFVAKWLLWNPNFTGSIEFHFFGGHLKDIKSHQSHKQEIDDGMQRRQEERSQRRPA